MGMASSKKESKMGSPKTPEHAQVADLSGIDIEPLTSIENSGSPVAYSVIIKPVSENAKKPIVSPGRAKENLNRDVLEERQKAADKRRKMLEIDRLARLAVTDERIKQAQAKVQENTEQQSKITEEKIKQKQENQKEKRDAILKALQERLQASNEKIREAKLDLQKSIETQSKVTEAKLRAKLQTMEEKRESILLSIKEKLHAKSVQIEQARKDLQINIQTQKEILGEKIQNDMEEKEENRQAYLKQKIDRSVHRHADEIQQAKQQLRATEATG